MERFLHYFVAIIVNNNMCIEAKQSVTMNIIKWIHWPTEDVAQLYVLLIH